MGNSPLTVCISQAWEKQTVQVVLPDGQVLFMPHPLTVAMLMEAHPTHFVCQGSPSLSKQRRLSINEKLESGEIYYLIPSPHDPTAVSTTGPTTEYFTPPPQQQQQQQLKVMQQQFPEQVMPPSLLFDKAAPSSFSDCAHLTLRSSQCFINLFLVRHGVASIIPEESLKQLPKSTQGNNQQVAPPPVLLTNNNRSPLLQCDQSLQQQQQQRKVKGRKQVTTGWKPQLESISETRPVLHDLSPSFTINKSDTNIFVSVTTTTSGPTSSPTSFPLSSSPLINLVPPPRAHAEQFHEQKFHKGQECQLRGVMHVSEPGDHRESPHRQKKSIFPETTSLPIFPIVSSPLRNPAAIPCASGRQWYQQKFHQEQQRLHNVRNVALPGDHNSNHRPRFVYVDSHRKVKRRL